MMTSLGWKFDGAPALAELRQLVGQRVCIELSSGSSRRGVLDQVTTDNDQLLAVVLDGIEISGNTIRAVEAVREEEPMEAKRAQAVIWDVELNGLKGRRVCVTTPDGIIAFGKFVSSISRVDGFDPKGDPMDQPALRKVCDIPTCTAHGNDGRARDCLGVIVEAPLFVILENGGATREIAFERIETIKVLDD